MIDRKVQMMDAGMVLFQTEKPFGTVLGGIKTELLKYGKVLRRNEFNESELPETTGECDLFLDWSAPLRKRYISVRLEDAGTVGKTEDGEEIHRYAACLKEGNRCTATRLVLAVGLVLLFGITGAIIPCPVPHWIMTILCLVPGLYLAFKLVEPSRKAQKVVKELLGIIRQAR